MRASDINGYELIEDSLRESGDLRIDVVETLVE